MDSKHSPLPWIPSTRIVNDVTMRTVSTSDERGHDHGTVAVLYSQNPKDDQAMICAAVNAHESLTARNRRLEAALERAVALVDDVNDHEFGCAGKIHPVACACWISAARAALSETTDGNEQKARV